MFYQNKQLYYECRLVSLWNACRYYGIKKIPVMGSKRYYKICKKARGINGAVIIIKDEVERLLLKYNKGSRSLKWVKSHLPVELGIVCHRGYHSVLCIKVKKNKLCLTNYSIGKLCWIDWKSLKKKMRDDPSQIVKYNK